MDEVEDKYVDMAEAVELTGYKRGSLYQMISRGTLPYYKAKSRKVFFKMSDLRELTSLRRMSSDAELTEKAKAIFSVRRI